MMDQDTLLAYLAHCITLSASSGKEFSKADMFLNAYRRSNADHSGSPVLPPSKDIPAESKPMASIAELEIVNPALKSVDHILLKVKAAWLLLQSECSKEAFRALRFYSLRSLGFQRVMLLFHVYSKFLTNVFFLTSCPGHANRS